MIIIIIIIIIVCELSIRTPFDVWVRSECQRSLLGFRTPASIIVCVVRYMYCA
jgi:hypothetical protein